MSKLHHYFRTSALLAAALGGHAVAQSVSQVSDGAPLAVSLPVDQSVTQALSLHGPLASLSFLRPSSDGTLRLATPSQDLHPHLAGAVPVLPSLYQPGNIPVLPPVLSEEQVAVRDILRGEQPWPIAIPVEMRETLADLYSERENEPLWHLSGRWREGLDAALYQIENAHEDGLNPQDYLIEEAFNFFQASNPIEVAISDLSLTAMMLPYVNHMANGRHPESRRFNPSDLLVANADDENVLPFFQALIPEKVEYQRLRSALADARANRAEQVFIPLFSEGAYLRAGQTDARVAELRSILELTGDYTPAETPATGEPLDPAFFDENLNEAVLAFQVRKGLLADGIVGRGTRRALNARSGSMIALMKINMERLRWEAPLNGETTYVRVNIPQYRLHIRDGGEVTMDMRTIVGRADRATPIMSDRIVNLKFSPDWTVPSTILNEDIIPRLQANPGYAAAAGYSIIRNGTRVNASSIDWSNPPRVTVYKNPSANGPLGGVRFSLTNSNGIFLHDTNNKSIFRQIHRDDSSGCVRVGDPAGLAAYLVRTMDGWDRSRVERAMNRGAISWAELPNDGVPVYLSYMTLFVDEDGNLQTTDDPYGKDRRLLRHFDDS